MQSPSPRSVDQRRRLVAAVHDTPVMLVLAVAGGGNAVMLDLLEVGGASRTVLEMVVPYAESAMVDFAGSVSDDRPMVSEGQAEVMARAALARARFLAPDGCPVIGVGVTAALASDRPKRGQHRAHLAVAGLDAEAGTDGVAVTSAEVRLVKGAFDREAEDRLVADAALTMIAAACGLEPDAR